ncbi:MAG: AAA family ATPase, partial [Devosia sp.]
TVDFKNTMIIMTSNLGAEYLTNLPEGSDTDQVRDQVMDVVKSAFRPEFLNRVDEILLFHRLGREHMGAIVDIQFGRLQQLLKDRDIVLELTPRAREWLANEGYDPAYGARPLKRVIQRAVQDELAEEILGGRVADGSSVLVDANDEGVVLRPGGPGAADAAA